MKRLTLTIAMLCTFLLPASSFPQLLWDPGTGVPVRDSFNARLSRGVATSDNGETCVTWSDTRSGFHEVYAQLYDSNGNTLWGDGGVAVTSADSTMLDPQVVPSSDGGWLIAWMRQSDFYETDYAGQIFAQKLDHVGELQWEDETNPELPGIPVSDPDVPLWNLNYRIHSNLQGGLFVVWNQQTANGDMDILAVNIGADGELEDGWLQYGSIIAGGDGDQGTYYQAAFDSRVDDAGGLVCAYRNSTTPHSFNLTFQRISFHADTLLAPVDEGLILEYTTGDSDVDLQLRSDRANGWFVSWRSLDGFYIKRIHPDGESFWNAADNARVGIEPRSFHSIVTAPGEMMFIWRDYDLSLGNDILMQQIHGDSIPLYRWNQAQPWLGTQLADTDAGTYSFRCIEDGNGGIFVAWNHYSEPSRQNQIFIQHVDNDGTVLWNEPDGLVIQDSLERLNNFVIATTPQGVLATWAHHLGTSEELAYQLIDPVTGDHLYADYQVVRSGAGGYGWDPEMLVTGDAVYTLYRDERVFNEVFPSVQKQSLEDGSLLWGDAGVLLAPAYLEELPSEHHFTVQNLQIRSDDEGALYASWASSWNGLYGYRATVQKFTPEGTLLWGDRGVLLEEIDPEDYFETTNPYILPDGDGGLYCLYNKFSEVFFLQIRAQHFDASGVRQWSEGDEDGIALTEGIADHDLLAMKALEESAFAFLYRKNDEDGNVTINLQAINSDGTFRWEEPVLLIGPDEYPSSPVYLYSVPDGVAAFWAKHDMTGPPEYSITYQLVNPDGSLRGPEEGYTLYSSENIHQGRFQVAFRSEQDYSFWITYFNEQENPEIRRFTLSGEPVTNAVELHVPDPFNLIELQLVAGSDNSAYLIANSTNDYSMQLLYSHVTSEGHLFPGYSEEMSVLNSYNSFKLDVRAVPDGSSGFISMWEDYRLTAHRARIDIVGMRVNDGLSTAQQQGPELPSTVILSPAFPNPFNPATSVTYTLSQRAYLRLTVYDLLGREVARLLDGPQDAGTYRAIWDGTSTSGAIVAAGTYFLELDTHEAQRVQKLLLVK